MGEKQFEMEEYLHKRMLEIKSLEDRNLFKQVVEEALLKLYEYNQSAYERLEKRVLSECRPPQNQCAVYLSIIDLKHYDATDSFLFPMREEDIKEEKLSARELLEGIREKKETKLYTVFLKGSASKIYELLHQKDRVFQGSISTAKGEYRAVFRVKKNREYLDRIEELYYIFGETGQPWLTVCGAYLNKLLDVYLCRCEHFQEKEEILRIQVDFEEYADLIHYDMIPLWNLQTIEEKSSTYPEPCIDRINFEHRIFAHRLKSDCAYLVKNRGVEISNIRRSNGDLSITCRLDRPCEWQLYQVNQRKRKGSYPYPVLSNQYKESFSDNLTEMYRKSIKTKGEMARLIEAFEYGEYVSFSDFHLCEHIPQECIPMNYNMDSFIADELRADKTGQPMVIDFMAAAPDNFLNEDIMSFLVTQVQRILPEFHCIGRLV